MLEERSPQIGATTCGGGKRLNMRCRKLQLVAAVAKPSFIWRKVIPAKRRACASKRSGQSGLQRLVLLVRPNWKMSTKRLRRALPARGRLAQLQRRGKIRELAERPNLFAQQARDIGLRQRLWRERVARDLAEALQPGGGTCERDAHVIASAFL